MSENISIENANQEMENKKQKMIELEQNIEIKKEARLILSLYEETETNIKESSKAKATKDVVGKNFENTLQKIIKIINPSLECELRTKNKDFGFTADNTITKNGKIVMICEYKGHYLDSCFLERALIGIAKTIVNFLEQNMEIPLFEICSFTTYKLYYQKFEETLNIFRDDIKHYMREKVVYNTFCDSDRIKSKNWFKKGVDNHPYVNNVSIYKIIHYIKYIRSL